MSARKIALAPFGSEGDANPLVWAGRALAAEGHEPLMLLTPNYGPLAEAAGLPWQPVGKPGDFEEMTRDRRFWRPFTGPLHVGRAMLATFPAFQEAWRQLPWKPSLAIMTTFGFAAAFEAEAAGIPTVMIHLQPAVLFSARDFPVLAPGLGWLRRAPLPIRNLFAGVVRASLHALLLPQLNRRRSAAGLPRWTDFLGEAVLGADAVGLLFPEAFASAAEASLPRVRQFGFPLPESAPPLPAEIAHFIEKFGPPVVWTHGSANHDTSRFARCALATADIRPCLLVCPEPPPCPLPPRALHVPHAPFESLFGLCRAVVHHGGIGTTAKALAARKPQLIIPRAHDQPDNAARVVRMGKGHALSYIGLSAASARQALARLLAEFPALLDEAPGLRACPHSFAQWAAGTAKARDVEVPGRRK